MSGEPLTKETRGLETIIERNQITVGVQRKKESLGTSVDEKPSKREKQEHIGKLGKVVVANQSVRGRNRSLISQGWWSEVIRMILYKGLKIVIEAEYFLYLV